jgi:hypothetical protein
MANDTLAIKIRNVSVGISRDEHMHSSGLDKRQSSNTSARGSEGAGRGDMADSGKPMEMKSPCTPAVTKNGGSNLVDRFSQGFDAVEDVELKLKLFTAPKQDVGLFY